MQLIANGEIKLKVPPIHNSLNIGDIISTTSAGGAKKRVSGVGVDEQSGSAPRARADRQRRTY